MESRVRRLGELRMQLRHHEREANRLREEIRAEQELLEEMADSVARVVHFFRNILRDRRARRTLRYE